MRTTTADFAERAGARASRRRWTFLVSTGILAAAGGVLGAPTNALSQTTAQAASSDHKDNGTTVETVVVTARKQSENIQAVPESIQAIGAKELVNAHVARIDDLGNLVSNLNITTRFDQTPDVVLRGVGSFGVINGVGFYSDDVQLFDGQTVRPEDLARVEVLKGPQGTLYGGSNIGGAIKFITKLPTDYFQGQASVEVGNYDTKTESLALSGPIVPGSLDGRVSVFDSMTGGYIYDPVLGRNVNDGEERGGRFTLQHTGGPTTVTLYVDGEQYAGNASSEYYRAQSDTSYTLKNTDGTLPEFRRYLYSATLNVDHKFDNGLDLTSISSGFHSYEHTLTDVDKGPLPFVVGLEDFNRDVFSEELRLSNGTGGAFKWMLGAFALANDPNFDSTTTSFNGDPSSPAQLADPTQYSAAQDDLHQTHREYALFGNGQYTWNQWNFELGLRADYNESKTSDRSHPGLPDQYLTQQGTQVLPKFSISYNIAKDVMAYTTVSRGFEPGDVQLVFDSVGTPSLGTYKPESTWNYEVGLKSTLFDRVRFNVAAFYLDYADRLVQNNRLENGVFVAVIDNVGTSHNYGIETDISARLVDRLFLTVSAGVTQAIWGNIPNFYDPDASAAAGTPVYVNLKGRSATNVPAYSATVSLDWSHDIANGLTLGLRADATAIGKSYWDVTDHYEQPAYQLVNLGVRLETKDWTLGAHVSNVFNVLYNTAFGSSAEVGTPTDVAGIGSPRLWSASITRRF